MLFICWFLSEKKMAEKVKNANVVHLLILIQKENGWKEMNANIVYREELSTLKNIFALCQNAVCCIRIYPTFRFLLVLHTHSWSGYDI